MLSWASLPWTVSGARYPRGALGCCGWAGKTGTRNRGSVNICLASGENQAAVTALPALPHLVPIMPHVPSLFPLTSLFWAFASLFLPSLVMLWPLRKARDVTESNNQFRSAAVLTRNRAMGVDTYVRFVYGACDVNAARSFLGCLLD